MNPNELDIQLQQAYVTSDGKRFATELDAKLYIKRMKHMERAKKFVEAKGTYQAASATRIANLIAEFLAFEEMATEMAIAE